MDEDSTFSTTALAVFLLEKGVKSVSFTRELTKNLASPRKFVIRIGKLKLTVINGDEVATIQARGFLSKTRRGFFNSFFKINTLDNIWTVNQPIVFSLGGLVSGIFQASLTDCNARTITTIFTANSPYQ